MVGATLTHQADAHHLPVHRSHDGGQSVVEPSLPDRRAALERGTPFPWHGQTVGSSPRPARIPAMTATVGALLLGVGLVWGVGEPGAEEALLFLIPGVVLLVVGLLLRSHAKTRQELVGIRVQLEALGRPRPQADE